MTTTYCIYRIPRQTIPINENTGKINIEFHQAILEAIEEREKQDVINSNNTDNNNVDYSNNNIDNNNVDISIDNNVSSNQKFQEYPLDNNNNSIVMINDQQKQLNNDAIEESLWMSLTASISTTTNSSISNMSFSLFPELLTEDDNDNDNMLTSFFNDDDGIGGGGGGDALTDINIITNNNENNGIMATATAAVNNTDDHVRINIDGITEVLRPKSNDIIMGKG